MPDSSNRPRLWFSVALARSPSNTWTRTSLWFSTAVEKIRSARVGIVVLRGIMTCITPPTVCSPRDSGVTSRRTKSFTRSSSTMLRPPLSVAEVSRMAACTAAPIATTSSGLTRWHRALPPKKADRMACTLGMRVEPPTSTISFTSSRAMAASVSACSTGPIRRCSRSSLICSKVSRVRWHVKSWLRWRASTCTVVSMAVERMRLARSAEVRSRRIALALFRMEPSEASTPRSSCCLSKRVAR
mmetsp:Transcript_8404/g.24101  ORF Transcript_8404/g.24101 Transcript_8404/m.24101 type:complete len:243 (+) Transcript_8404:977-1705(+)